MDIIPLDNRLEILKWKKHGGLLEELLDCGERNCVNIFKGWTPLKLIGLSTFAGIYSSILRSQLKEATLIYIDLFSGSGINKIKDSGEIFVGSPLAFIDSVSNRHLTFDKMYFNDINPSYIEALNKRLKYLGKKDTFNWISENYELFNLDCNEAIDTITKKINSFKFKNYLAFIDPIKWQLNWSSLKKLLSIKNGDIFITLQSLLTAKEIGSLKKGRLKEKKELLKNFLGEENEEVITNLDLTEGINLTEAVRKLYIDKIKEYKPYVEYIKISAGGIPYNYYLIYATGKPEPKWSDAIMSLKNFIESYSGIEVTTSIDYSQGKQKRMDDYLK